MTFPTSTRRCVGCRQSKPARLVYARTSRCRDCSAITGPITLPPAPAKLVGRWPLGALSSPGAAARLRQASAEIAEVRAKISAVPDPEPSVRPDPAVEEAARTRYEAAWRPGDIEWDDLKMRWRARLIAAEQNRTDCRTAARREHERALRAEGERLNYDLTIAGVDELELASQAPTLYRERHTRRVEP
jgi:hypothetical protein